MKVTSGCSQATTNAVQTANTEEVQSKEPSAAQAQAPAELSEKDTNLGKNAKSDLQFTGKMKAAELAKTAPSKEAPKTESAKEVESAMEKKRAEGGSRRDVVVAGAKADQSNVELAGDNPVAGKDRIFEVYRETAKVDLDPNTKFDKGRPLMNAKDGTMKPNSWCGVWATDVWRRSGVPVEWKLGVGPVDPSGKRMETKGISGNRDKELQNVKPGDIIVLNNCEKGTGKIKPGSTNHHAIVTERVFEPAGKPGERVTCPPNPVPEGGKLVGFHTMDGNNPGVDENGKMVSIRKSYVDLTQNNYKTEADGKEYSYRISNYYPMPEPSAQTKQ